VFVYIRAMDVAHSRFFASRKECAAGQIFGEGVPQRDVIRRLDAVGRAGDGDPEVHSRE
jgi:hypothetical protein